MELTDTPINSEVTPVGNSEAVRCDLNTTALKNKLLSGEFSIDSKRGRSKVWEVFRSVKNENGDIIEKIVACRTCYNIYKHNSKTTSNLVRHICYVLKQSNKENTEIDVDSKTKAITTEILTQWTVQNCRPFLIVNDTGLHQLIQHCLQIGARFGKNINIALEMYKA